MPTEGELTAYYNSSYTVAHAPYRARVEEEFPYLQKLVNRAGTRPGRMLEIGCSYGNMLARFASAGWEVEGVEVDARTAVHARDVLGLAIHQGSLEDVRAALRPPYDVVTMFHVIEHVRCITSLVDGLAALMPPGGLLVLKTPNATSLMSRILRGWWEWSAVPEHVHLFTSTSLRTVLVGAGFTTELVITRRGDARGTLHELMRGGVRRLDRTPPLGERLFEAADQNATMPPPISRSARYATLARVLDGAGWPLDWILDASSRASEASLLPELLVVARRSRAQTHPSNRSRSGPARV